MDLLESVADEALRSGSMPRGWSLASWLEDGADLAELCSGWCATATRLRVTRDVHRAWGYLEGVADAADLTVGEMLGSHGIRIGGAA